MKISEGIKHKINKILINNKVPLTLIIFLLKIMMIYDIKIKTLKNNYSNNNKIQLVHEASTQILILIKISIKLTIFKKKSKN